MSGRIRPSCGSADSASKSGPMRATLPVSSVLKTPGRDSVTPGLRKSCGNSPTLSPTNIWRRISPDNGISGQRSPGGVGHYKGRTRYGCVGIRRTASLDTLCQAGQWPRDYLLAGHLQLDKATQTEEGGGWSGSGSGRSSRASDEDKLERFLRARLPRGPHRASAEHSSQITCLWSRYGTTGAVPLRATRSSVEGLNQEIERLVLHPNKTPTPEGNREMLRPDMMRRSVNTQTPLDPAFTTHSSGGSVCSSPDADGARLGSSPQINRFLAREPPDGCEKVNLKSKEPVCWGGGEETRVSAPAAFQLRPSLTSAFQPLRPHHDT